MLTSKFNLSRQLLVSVLVIYFLITLLVTAIHVMVEYKYTKNHIKDVLKTMAIAVEPAIQAALWDMNNKQLESVTDGIVNIPLIYGIVIIDPNMVKLINKIDSSLSKVEMNDYELSYRFKIHQKFNNNDIYLADVIIYSDDIVVFDRLKVGLSMTFLNAFIKTAALIILFIVAFRSHLAKPLQELTQKISSLKWESKENRHIEVKFTNENELSVLQSTFNKLLAKISSEEDRRFELINTQKSQLENQVKERTKELEDANNKLQKLAQTDRLTQLNNRFKIDEELDIKYDNFKRYKRVFSVIMLDVDFFKIVNDEHGHQIGDYVLKMIATILKKNVRSTDILGRWGREEFFIICGDTDIQGAYKLAENIRKVISDYIFEHVEHKTASFGVSQIEDGLSIDDIIKKADDALYEAKNSGRNKVVKATLS